MKYTKKHQTDFSQNMQRSLYVSLLLGSILMWFFIYTFLPPALFTEKQAGYYTILFTGVILFIIQILAGVSVITKNQISPISKKIISLLRNPKDFTKEARTDTVYEIIQFPKMLSKKIISITLLSNLLILLCVMIFFQDDERTAVFLVFPFLLSSACTGLLTYDSLTAVCSNASKLLTAEPLDEKRIDKERHFGTTLIKDLKLHIFYPFIGFALTIFLICISHFTSSSFEIKNAVPLILMGFIYLCVFTRNYKNKTIKAVYSVNNILDEMIKEDSLKSIPFDLNYDISYTAFLINRLFANMKETSFNAQKAANRIHELTEQIGKEFEVSRGKMLFEEECVSSAKSSMAEIEKYIENLSKQISDVALTSKETLDTINEGTVILNQNMNKIEQITQSNIDTISGIKDLSDKIESIWTVISTIDSITEKTRTIAFNAEIETSSLGDMGENFHIVANEIRRLADSITDSTLSIKKKITSIQHASDNLVITSEGGTEKIREESELFTNLEEKFDELKLSGQVTEESSELIWQILQNQKETFAALSNNLMELNGNIENFKTCSTKIIAEKDVIQEAFNRSDGGDENAE